MQAEKYSISLPRGAYYVYSYRFVAWTACVDVLLFIPIPLQPLLCTRSASYPAPSFLLARVRWGQHDMMN